MARNEDQREPVYELRKKIEFLLQNPAVQNLCGHNGSLNSFCEKTGIKRHKLRPVPDSDPDMLSRPAQIELAKACRFGVDWVEWTDPDADRSTPHGERKDTAEHFQRRWLQENHAPAKGPPAAPRRTGARLTATRPYASETFVDPDLATIDLHAQQPGPGEPWPVSIDLVCRPAVVEGVWIAVKRGRLDIDCGGAHTTGLEQRAGYPDGADYSRGKQKITVWPGGTSQRPSWMIEANPGPLGLLRLPKPDEARDDDYFFLIFDVAPDYTIVGSLSAYIKDLVLEPDGDGGAAPPGDSVSFMFPDFQFPDFQKLSRVKQKILKRLAEMELPGGDNDWVQLCRAAIAFKEIGNAGDDQKSET